MCCEGLTTCGWKTQASQPLMFCRDSMFCRYSIRTESDRQSPVRGLRIGDRPDCSAIQIAALDTAVDGGAVERAGLAVASDDASWVAAAHFVGELEQGRLCPRSAL